MGSSYKARVLVVSDVLHFSSGWKNHLYASLKNHGADADADAMFDMGAETMKLSMEEKMKYEQGDEGVSFGCASNLIKPSITA